MVILCQNNPFFTNKSIQTPFFKINGSLHVTLRGQSRKNLLIMLLLIYPPLLSSFVSFLTIDRYTRLKGGWMGLEIGNIWILCISMSLKEIVSIFITLKWSKNDLAFEWIILYNYYACIWTYLLMSFCKERVHEIWSQKCFMKVMIISRKSYYEYEKKDYQSSQEGCLN